MRLAISGYVGTKLTGIGRVLIEVLNEMAPMNINDEYILFKNFDFNDAEQVWNSSSAYQEHHDLNNKNKNRWLPGTANYYNTCNEIIKKSPQLKNIFEKTKRENEKKY